jgi:hypothetical protein
LSDDEGTQWPVPPLLTIVYAVGVNRLVKALLAHPNVVDEVIPRGRADFEFLLRRLGDELMTEQEWSALPRDPVAAPSLRAGYLPVITAGEWEQALDAAQEGPDDAGWGTVMLRNSSGDFGVTAPQDPSDEPVVALFTGPADNPQRVVYRLIESTYVDLADGAHCGTYSRGNCGPGTCGGCRPRKVWDTAAGIAIKCRCDDQAPD